jgi:hypothetical protein
VPGDNPGAGPLPNDPDLVPDLVNRHDSLKRVIWWFLAAPTLANVDATTDELEILAGAGDRPHLRVPLRRKPPRGVAGTDARPGDDRLGGSAYP